MEQAIKEKLQTHTPGFAQTVSSPDMKDFVAAPSTRFVPRPRSRPASRQGTGPFDAVIVGSNYWQDDIVLLLFELEDELDVGKLVGDAKVDGRSGADKVH